ncbi:hypothetical protein GCM10010987_76220 [Bradyrhizobium guangdongense]|uniref:Uncharacterized protein n=1 Tax=Bradyrhizobium guangdongense TaxID=1325090 RepID=A0AA88BCX9_9BRAD|nr:hypothetical protein GCM10010987_76220 [Bradyrhizobium guangdongense]
MVQVTILQVTWNPANCQNGSLSLIKMGRGDWGEAARRMRTGPQSADCCA